ncbi:MAG: hypothetical protein JSR71_09785 [Proteobacteria bacterium]|nr:hypothetical protein [Pseudomonadota bacterium]
MKKIALILTLLLSSSTCFAIVNFTSKTGNLVMREVSVDGSTVYDSVTLQLNLANGTFTILDATLKDTSFSETALDTTTLNGVKVDFMGCALSGKNQITCKTKVTSINKDQTVEVEGSTSYHYGGDSSKLFDNLGNEYNSSTVTALDKSGSDRLVFNIIQGVPVEIKFIYNNINPAATSISAFKPYFYPETGLIIGNFRDIAF